MKKILLSFVVFLNALFFTGCIELSTLINVNSDGSGTVEETVMMSSKIIEMISELEKSFTDDTTEYEPFQFYDEEALKNQASDLGDEVRYVSSKKISRSEKEGYLVMYEFRDINKLQINQNPNSRVKLESFEDEPEVEMEYITFSFIDGNPDEIRIQMPTEKQFVSDTTITLDTVDADTTMMNQQIAEIFKDLKITLALNINGNIIRTNADYVEGSRVTLLEVNFGELIQNAEKMREFRDTDPQNFEQVKKIIKGIPGIKVDTNNLIFVQFK
jgi:glutaredoxin-related protein